MSDDLPVYDDSKVMRFGAGLLAEFLSGVRTDRTLGDAEERWWLDDDGESPKDVAGEAVSVHHRLVRVAEGGVNAPGVYTQTAIVGSGKLYLVTGKVTEVLLTGV